MKYGWITINITDMWEKPRYNSERINQLLFYDLIKILDEKDNFYLVEKYDKYIGWVDKNFVSVCPYKRYQQYMKQKKYVVTAKTLSVSINQNNILNPHFLYYGTTFVGSKIKDSKIKITLPDNNSAVVSSFGVTLLSRKQKPTASAVLKEAKRFLGVPYLWGGISSAGFDCSGFTQTILSRFGIEIPRDTKDQIKIGREIQRDEIRTGDILFFNRHVGFAIGKNEIIHSSVGGGGVRTNSISSQEKEYREDLDESFKTARRIL